MKRLLLLTLALASLLLAACQPQQGQTFSEQCDRKHGLVEQLRDARGNPLPGKRICIDSHGRVVGTDG